MKRKYNRSLPFIEAGFRACMANAGELVVASKLLLDAGHHAISLSVAILALEEMGKLFLIDGLLFSDNDSHKTDFFARSLRSHDIKLDAIRMLPWLAVTLAKHDPRFEKDHDFRSTLLIAHKIWDQSGQDIIELSGRDSFQFLNEWKQSGFYVSLVNGNKLQAPCDAIDRTLAGGVVKFADVSYSTLDFSATDAAVSKYFALAGGNRSKLRRNDHEEIEARAEAIMADLFPEAFEQ